MSPQAAVYFSCEPTHLRDMLGFNLTVKTAAAPQTRCLSFVSTIRGVKKKRGNEGTKGWKAVCEGAFQKLDVKLLRMRIR